MIKIEIYEKKLKLMSVGYKLWTWLGLFCVWGWWISNPIKFDYSGKAFPCLIVRVASIILNLFNSHLQTTAVKPVIFIFTSSDVGFVLLHDIDLNISCFLYVANII